MFSLSSNSTWSILTFLSFYITFYVTTVVADFSVSLILYDGCLSEVGIFLYPKIQWKTCSLVLVRWSNKYFSVLDPDPGAKMWKMLNNHNIILLFSDFYNILSFNWLLFMRKSYNYEVILIFFQILLRNSLDPDWDFWLDPYPDVDPDSIEYGSETLHKNTVKKLNTICLAHWRNWWFGNMQYFNFYHNSPEHL